jgi:hypothetical protein
LQEKAFYSLAAFCENLKEEILPYLAPLMDKLLEALQSNRRDIQETCMVETLNNWMHTYCCLLCYIWQICSLTPSNNLARGLFGWIFFSALLHNADEG